MVAVKKMRTIVSSVSMSLSGTHRSTQFAAHLSILLIVSHDSEDDQVQEVDQEMKEKHSTCKLLPLLFQQLAQGLRLEHLVAVLGGDKSRPMFESSITRTDALKGLVTTALTGMSLL